GARVPDALASQLPRRRCAAADRGHGARGELRIRPPALHRARALRRAHPRPLRAGLAGREPAGRGLADLGRDHGDRGTGAPGARRPLADPQLSGGMMRALVVEEYGPYDSHRLRDGWPEPAAAPGKVLIATRAMSVNFPDVLMVEGGYQHRPKPPVVAGFDVSGVVEAVGEGVTRVSPGDRVLAYVADGAFAEKVLAPDGSVWKMPDEMPFEHGAVFGLVYLTAHASLVENCRA